MVFRAPEASYYNIKIGNFDSLDATNWIGKLSISGSEDVSIAEYNFEYIDSNGFIYKKVYLSKGQACFLRYYNYVGKQLPYAVCVAKVPKRNVSAARVIIDGIQLTSGSKIPKAKPEVVIGNDTLQLNRDYTLSYSYNKKTATMTVTITGIGQCIGNKKVTYKVADKRYVLLTRGGSLVYCTAKGKSLGKKIDREVVEGATTLYIASNVKNVPNKVGICFNERTHRVNIGFCCTSVKKIVFLRNAKGKSSCKSISSEAFRSMGSLTTVKYLEKTSLKTIGKFCFAHCGVLRKISVPKTIRAIDDTAFYKCTNLKKIGGLSKSKSKKLLAR